MHSDKLRTVAKIANYTISIGRDSTGTIFTNRGAAGPVTFTIPPSYNLAGVSYEFEKIAAQTFTLAGGVSMDVISRVRLFCDGTSWLGAETPEIGQVTLARTTMTGNVVLTSASAPYQFFDPNGSNRTVALPVAATGMSFVVKHFGGANTVTVNTTGGALVIALSTTDVATVIYDGTAWVVL